MKFAELSASLKNNVEQCYFLTGEDGFLKSQAEKLIFKYSGRELEEINYAYFTEENFSVKKFEESVFVPPLNNNKRVVSVKHISKLSENDRKEIQKIISNLPEETCVVFNCDIPTFKDCEIVDCSGLDELNLKKYIIREIQNAGKQISNEALETLIKLKNNSLTLIVSELPKIINYSDENLIVADTVKLLVSPEVDFQIYELTDALGSKNKNKTLEILNFLLENKNANVLSLITNHFRRVAFTSLSEYTNDQLAEMFDVKPYAILKARNQSRFFSKIQLKNILETLENVDYMIKSGEMQSENAIYYLIFKILYC